MTEPAVPDIIVVVDDDYAMRLTCRKILAKAGFQVETFEDGAQGLEAVARLRPGLVLVDLKMPGISGMEVISRVHEIDPDIVIAVITGYATIDTAVEAMKSGAYDFLPKPFSPDELRLIVNRGLERRRLVLEQHRQEVERALLQRRFITFVSHQLQTPLVAVHQYLDVLRDLSATGDVATKGAQWIERCLKRIEEMQATIKDWLTLSKVSDGSFVRRRIKVDLARVISDILNTYQDLAASRQLRLETGRIAANCFATGDPHCLAVVVDNLVTNAMKYNRPGGAVTVSAEPEDGEMVIRVKDTGIGIPQQYIPFLFDEFFRIKGGADRAPGTGLGLAICRKIVTELGGTIRVESEVGAGSTFMVRLPAWREQPDEVL